MLAVVSPLENKKCIDGKDQREMVDFSISGDDFVDFSGDNLLESIDFDDLFVGMDGQDFLPELELLAGDFSFSGGEDSSDFNNSMTSFSGDQKDEKLTTSRKDELVSRRERSEIVAKSSSLKGCRKSSSQEKSKISHSKRKVKVDWTPELHRKFVQAVEQLGLEKAVPSRILEIMGIDCLTRHNIASHLQKYRSHRKHLLAREAEAASWSKRRQMYGGKTAADGGGNNTHWVAPPPTMGFPPMQQLPHFRPLHVWGHPSVDRPLLPAVWPKHIVGNTPQSPHLPPHIWPSPPSPHPQPPTWHHHHLRVPSSLPPVAPYFQQLLPQTRFPGAGIPPPHAMYKIESGVGVGVSTPPTPQPPLDLHPSKESIDAAIGDILSKPWQPLPLGLKPPALDSVMVELHKQGIQKIPPSLSSENHKN